jgi:aryl-alcohol dehydrogenase-like predicted oxidoreductase
VTKIGVSIYEPDILDQLSSYAFDLVQAPLSPFDQRLKTSGWLSRLSRLGVEIHTRSAFLQGLLLLPSSRRPPQFSVWSEAWTAWDRYLDEQQLSPLSACLGFVLSQAEVGRVVVGVDGLRQLDEILAAPTGPFAPLPDALSKLPPHLLNPANWSKP